MIISSSNYKGKWVRGLFPFALLNECTHLIYVHSRTIAHLLLKIYYTSQLGEVKSDILIKSKRKEEYGKGGRVFTMTMYLVGLDKCM